MYKILSYFSYSSHLCQCTSSQPTECVFTLRQILCHFTNMKHHLEKPAIIIFPQAFPRLINKQQVIRNTCLK